MRVDITEFRVYCDSSCHVAKFIDTICAGPMRQACKLASLLCFLFYCFLDKSFGTEGGK
jgi:hypothetical protein